MSSYRERFLARQAILDRDANVVAYELLFRDSLENGFPGADGDMATSRVLSDSVLVFGIEELTGRAKAFVNFTENLLLDDQPLVISSEKLVVEILVSVAPNPAVLAACRRLKEQGYVLALDGFTPRPEDEPFLRLADIVKVDFQQTRGPARARLAASLRDRAIVPLAKRVETPEEYQEAFGLGYEMFQGYYYQRPALLSRRDLLPYKVHYLRVLKELNRPEPDFDDLAGLIQGDVALSLKLLRYINSATLGLRRPVASIREALWILGERDLRRWATLVSMAELTADKPSELLGSAMVRARLAELLAMRTGVGRRAPDYFLLGLFSLLDAIFDQPIEAILVDLSLTEDLSIALVGGTNPMSDVLALVVAQERGDWLGIDAAVARLDLDEVDLPLMHAEAIRFSSALCLEADEPTSHAA
jgi:EAL and modified HD-GYP domain-containing signal transduction protein